MPDVFAEWQKLCDEHEAAQDAHSEALAVVYRKFSEIAKGTSHSNPTDDDLSVLDTTRASLEEIEKRMKAFIKANT
jgi:hypothetical protein